MKTANSELKTNQDKYDAVLSEDKRIKEAHIIENKHTTLSTAQLKIEWEQLSTLILSNIQLLEKEIKMQEMTGVSAELMAEFKELFSHFDAEKKVPLIVTNLRIVCNLLVKTYQNTKWKTCSLRLIKIKVTLLVLMSL